MSSSKEEVERREEVQIAFCPRCRERWLAGAEDYPPCHYDCLLADPEAPEEIESYVPVSTLSVLIEAVEKQNKASGLIPPLLRALTQAKQHLPEGTEE